MGGPIIIDEILDWKILFTSNVEKPLSFFTFLIEPYADPLQE